jgi:hypothetical protein
MGFEGRSYEEAKRKIESVGQTLRSRVNNRSYVIGAGYSIRLTGQ